MSTLQIENIICKNENAQLHDTVDELNDKVQQYRLKLLNMKKALREVSTTNNEIVELMNMSFDVGSSSLCTQQV